MLILLRNFLILIVSIVLTLNLSGQDARSLIKSEFKGYNKQKILDTLIIASETYVEENPDTAMVLGEIAFEMANAGNDYKTQALAARWIAEAYFYKNEYRMAIEYYMKSAAAEYQNSNDSTGLMAERISDAAYCYQELGIYSKSRELFQLSLGIQERLGNKVEIGTNLLNIGTSYFFQAQYDKAVNYYSRTLEMDRESGDSSSIAITLNNLGMVYSRWGKHQKALDIYEESLKYTKDKNKRAIRYSNIGMTWYHLGEYTKALSYLERALEIDILLNQAIKIGIRKNEIGTVLAAMGRNNEALKLHKEALQIFREKEIIDSEIISLCDMGDLYRKTGQTEKAESAYSESISLAIKAGALHHLSRGYNALYEIAEERKDYRKALEYFKLCDQAKDSVFSSENHEQLARFEILFETQKKEQANQLLRKDIELKQRNNRFAWVIIVGLAIFLILVIFLYRSSTKNLKQNRLLLAKEQEIAEKEIAKREAVKRSLEDRIFAEQQINRLEREKYLAEIEYKNAELTNSTLCLVNKNEILGEIREKLKTAAKDDGIHDVVRFINAHTDQDQDWLKFKLSFEDIHPGFFDRIASTYPHLSENDIRLLSYLRINLSSREIAGLMNVTLEATNKSRQRLRKKLNLQAEADLHGFLRSV
jgi:tetratricopeptide (TPR) repeat protein